MRSRLAIVAAVGVGTALLLAGCGTDEDPIRSELTTSDGGVISDAPRLDVPDEAPVDDVSAGDAAVDASEP